jgi:hypothetical protein
VALRPGKPGEIWALSNDDAIGITPQEDGTMLVARTGEVNAAGVGSIASGGNIMAARTGDSQPTGAPEDDPNYLYTIYVPTGTVVEFLDHHGTGVVGSTTVS